MPGEAAGDNISPWVTAPMLEIQVEFLAPGLCMVHFSVCGCLWPFETEIAVGISFPPTHPSLSVSLSLLQALQINKSYKDNIFHFSSNLYMYLKRELEQVLHQVHFLTPIY